jgi:hypothetical protein
VKIFIFLLATTTSPDDNMDAAPANLGSNANNAGNGNGGDERRPGEEGAGGSGGKDKGKGKMTEAQEEDEEREREERARKALEQRREEVMSRLAADLAAEQENIRDPQMAAASLVQTLSELQELDAADPQFIHLVSPGPVNYHRSPTASGPVGDEDEPVSENPSERDPKAVYSEDENREGASQ